MHLGKCIMRMLATGHYPILPTAMSAMYCVLS